MAKPTKILLTLSIACFIAGMAFVTGLINVENLTGLYVALPAGAIFFGLFLISKLLEKETALFDAEVQANHAAAERRLQSEAPRPQRAPYPTRAPKEALAAKH